MCFLRILSCVFCAFELTACIFHLRIGDVNWLSRHKYSSPQSAALVCVLQVGGTHAGAEVAPLPGGSRVLADGESATGTIDIEVTISTLRFQIRTKIY